MRIFKYSNLWRGLAGVFICLFLVLVFVTVVMYNVAGSINASMGIQTSKIINKESDVEVDRAYFKSDYTDVLAPEAEGIAKLVADEDAFVIQEMEESAVLLRNENSALPLKSSEKNVTLFGSASAKPLYKPRSGGGAFDESRKVNLYNALKGNGFTINDTLFNAYLNSTTPARSTSRLGEEPASFYTEEIKASFAQHSDVAIVVITREGAEGSDLGRTGSDSDNGSYLGLHQVEKDMLEIVKNGGFGKIIVLDNSPYQLELGWLDDYNVDACVRMGTPGLKGFIGIANLLEGKANPSGKLAVTYSESSLSSAAVQNFGDFQYTNAADIAAQCIDSQSSRNGNAAHVNKYLIYQEGVYTGYRYYETRYEDAMLGRGNATGDAGVYASKGNSWNYADEMDYPFGFGLSYTTFSQKLDSVSVGSKSITVKVTVTNTGDVAGKSVVQVYAQTPYGQYEKDHKIEKPAIMLVDFGKTGMLESGKSETLEIVVDKYLLASWDSTAINDEGAYILSGGDYYISIGDDCHDALNNVLTKKKQQGQTVATLYDQNGKTVTGDAAKTYAWSASFDDTTYRYSEQTKTRVHNQFEQADLNHYIDNAVTYLTRQNWQGTFPKPITGITATQEMIDIIDGYWYEKPTDAPTVASIRKGEDNGIMLVDMKGVDYSDLLWDDFIAQLTFDELKVCVDDMNSNVAIARIGKPTNYNGDGPDGTIYYYQLAGEEKKWSAGPGASKDLTGATTAYVGQSTSTCSFSKELYAKRGYFIGEDCLVANVQQLWCPGANLLRTPFSGRNHEYYSEDPIMSYLAMEPKATAMTEKGVNVATKHFAGNDQETNRHGVSTFMTEQTWRETCMKGFESAFTKSKITGVMSAFNRIGLTYVGADIPTQMNVLRGEWGFLGVTISDAATSAYQHAVEGVAAGTDMWCISVLKEKKGTQILNRITETDDGYLLNCLRESNKRFYYTMANSNLMNGLDSDSIVVTITPWWKITMVTIDIILGVIGIGATIMLVVGMILKRQLI